MLCLVRQSLVIRVLFRLAYVLSHCGREVAPATQLTMSTCLAMYTEYGQLVTKKGEMMYGKLVEKNMMKKTNYCFNGSKSNLKYTMDFTGESSDLLINF